SSEDMVNWQIHNVINVKSVCPWIYTSWAPSITSRVESDGKTHFYMYFTNNAGSIGVMTATSPLGPWTDPIGGALINWNTPGRGEMSNIIDPGVTIDNQGVGWLAFGGGNPNSQGSKSMPGNARIVRLGSDMKSLVGNIRKIDAPHHFEANELNYIGGKYVFSYCQNWSAPDACAMRYMTATDPINGTWTDHGTLFRNPGNFGYSYGNNHTHLQKFKGNWYLFYHTQWLEKQNGIDKGFRNISCQQVTVDENNVSFSEIRANNQGPSQISSSKVNPFTAQSAATMANAAGKFSLASENHLNINSSNSWTMVKGVDFSKGTAKYFNATVKGQGTLEVHVNGLNNSAIATINFNENSENSVGCELSSYVTTTADVYFLFKNVSNAQWIDWQFTEGQISKIVAGEKNDVHLSAVDFRSWNGTGANASANGTLANNYGGGTNVEGGALLFGDNEVSNLKYADLTGCTKLTIQGSNGIQVRALFNRQTATGSDYVEKSGTITDGKFEINLNEVSSSYVHLNAIKTNWGSPAGTISNMYVKDPNTPIDYYISGSGTLDESATNALSDPNAKNINAFGLTNEEPVALNTANKNCLIYVNSNNKVSNTSNVVLKNGNSYTANNIVLADGGKAMTDIAQAGFPWASTSGSAQWNSAGGDAYTFSWTASNDAVEIFHNLTGKTQNYLVVKTSEFTAPWGVRFYDSNGNLITAKEYWVGQASNNMIKEINIDSLFAENNVSSQRGNIKTVSIYGIGSGNGKVTLLDMFLASGGGNGIYPFFAPYNITANNIKCSISVDTFSPAWIPFEAGIPNGYEAYEIDAANSINKVSRIYPNKPLIISGKGIAEFTATNATINATNTLTNGSLIGVTEKTQPEAGTYAFVKITGNEGIALKEITNNDGTYVNPLHAYITKNVSSNVVKGLGNLINGQDPNAIGTMTKGNKEIKEIYNVTGAKINTLQKGLNIIKMSDETIKKVLVK
ncbi:MAG: family 43 glycosylhydrolase, partial [Bacteroidales bacterium]|nr:family 43 glycosylhydrolase [Bacteroidales bacterium]